MGIYLNPGNDAFKEALNSEIYVDKTGLIGYTNRVLGTDRKNICVSRPRRFGKSMAANMLCAYYGRGCDSENLFSGLSIETASSYREHLNQHDVIFLNIQQFLRGTDDFLHLSAYIEKKVLSEIKTVYPQLVDRDEKRLPDALAAIYAKDKSGFIFIIDEWDCIFREEQKNTVGQKQYLDFLKDLLKDRTYVKLAYMTGILPIKKYGTHSALNIFDEFSMTAPKYLSEYVGFTENEVRILCDRYEMNFEEMKQWYDGYLLENSIHVYNPKSIVDAMFNRKITSYWTRTETYEALKIYIDMNFDGLKDSVITMIGGGRCRVNSERFQNDMTSLGNRDDVLTLLIHLGYLAYDESTGEVFIPNMEIEGEFKNAVEGEKGWDVLSKALENSEQLLEDTLCLDSEAVAHKIDVMHDETTSILSYNDENSLSCVITIAYYSAKKDYILIRELPTGKGFADIVFLPKRSSGKNAFVVELKWDSSAEGAIEQIKKRRYGEALREYSGEVLLVGINYNKKTKLHECRIETCIK